MPDERSCLLNVQFLLIYDVTSDSSPRHNAELLMESADSSTCYIKGNVLHIGHSFGLNTIAAYEKVGPQDERSGRTNHDAVLAMRATVKLLNYVYEFLTWMVAC